MSLTLEQARNKLAYVFGDKETDDFLAEIAANKVIPDYLIEMTLILYDAYGPKFTHQIYEALNLEVPNVEDKIHNKGAKQLEQLRTDSWAHHFSDESPLRELKSGTTRLSVSAQETEQGRRLQASIVASMWNAENNDYFDVYHDVSSHQAHTELEPGVSFSVKGHDTTLYYHEDFPGLSAMQSMLNFTYQFMSDDNSEKKLHFQQESVDCINSYSQFIATILLELLPETAYEMDKSVLQKVAQLKGLLNAIQEKGLLNINVELYEPIEFTKKEFEELQKLASVKGHDITRMIKTICSDFKIYKEHVTALEDRDPSQFELAECLMGEHALDVLSPQAIINRLALLDVAPEEEHEEGHLVKSELHLSDLSRIANLEIEEITATEEISPPGSPTIRTKQAADLFLRPAITVRPEDSGSDRDPFYEAAPSEYAPRPRVSSDPDSFYDIAPMYWPNINAATVHRTSDDARPLMTTPNVLAVFKPGGTINFGDAFKKLGLAKPGKIAPIVPETDDTAFEIASVKAHWFDAKTKPASSEPGANVFGHLGTLEVEEDTTELTIPVHQANTVSQAFLEHFGATLVPLDQDIPYKDEPPVDLICAEYDFKEDYIPDYALQIKKGGGIFVETHEFRQFFTPLDKSCKGGIILGRKKNDGEFEFAAFEIPYGYSLVIEPNVIHGDSFFQGRYAIALTEVVSADSVLMRKPSGEILHVSQEAAVEDLPEVDLSKLRASIVEGAEMPVRPMRHQFFQPSEKQDNPVSVNVSSRKTEPPKA